MSATEDPTTVRPILKFRKWDSSLWECSRIENDLFIINPPGNPGQEEAVYELNYIHAKLTNEFKRMKVIYSYSNVAPRAYFLKTYPDGHQLYSDIIEVQGWGFPSPDNEKWTAEWSRERGIWLIVRWTESGQ